MKDKTQKRRCSKCRFWQSIGAGEFCDRIGMTGKSRIKEGLLSDGPYRPCEGYALRDEAEQKEMMEERRRGKFNESLNEGVSIMRTTGEKRNLRARDEARAQDRGDMAKALGLSPRAAEALYGGKSYEL